MQIDFLARRLKLPALAVEELGSDRTRFGIVAMLVSFAALLGTIFFLNVEAEYAAVFASACLLALLSEGSHGPHLRIPFITAGMELMVLVDDDRGVVVK